MTGTICFGVKTIRSVLASLALCTLVEVVLGPTLAVGQSGQAVSAGGFSDDGFSAALSDELPPAQYGTYQYIGPPSKSRLDRGFQYIDPASAGTQADGAATRGAPAATTPREHPFGTSAPTAWGHADLQQVQYPLMDETPDDLNELDRRTAASPRDPRFMAPIVTSPVQTPAAPSDGLGLQTQFLGDVTHVIGSGNSLGITTLTARAVLETPRLPGVSLRPIFGWHFLNGPRRTDLPGQLYDASIEARMYWPFSERIIGEFALSPGVYSDFNNTSGDALRIVGRAVGYYRWSPDLRLAAGATYLDREDVRALPIAGVIWTPTPDDQLTLLFPQPRIAHRYRKDADHERWVYLSGEFGGGSWAIQRASGRDDIVSYRDWRLITGIEFKYTDKTSWRIEGGYVFSRELEYTSNIGNYQLGDTSMIRAAFVY